MMTKKFCQIQIFVLILLCWSYSIYETSSHVIGRRVVLVTGNFTLDGEKLNLAQYDLQSGT